MSIRKLLALPIRLSRKFHGKLQVLPLLGSFRDVESVSAVQKILGSGRRSVRTQKYTEGSLQSLVVRYFNALKNSTNSECKKSKPYGELGALTARLSI